MQKFHGVRGFKFGSFRIFVVFQLQEVPPTSSCTDEFIKINGVCEVCGQLRRENVCKIGRTAEAAGTARLNVHRD